MVRAAGKGGREVILGGHSLGASLTAAYAAWDFNGKPGFEDVDGLVLIDGGLLGSFDAFDLAQAQQQIADLEDGNPFARPARDRHPRGRGAVRRGRRQSRAPATDGQRGDPAGVPAAAGRVQAAGPGRRTAACSATPSTATRRPMRSRSCTSTPAGSPRPASRATGADGGVTPIARLAETFGRSRSTRSSGISRDG